MRLAQCVMTVMNICLGMNIILDSEFMTMKTKTNLTASGNMDNSVRKCIFCEADSKTDKEICTLL